MTTAAAISYACSNYAAPEEGISDFCTCTNGATAPVVLAIGTNTGDNYVPCPYTTAPPLPPPPTTTSPQGGNQLYPYVTTILDGAGNTIVEECQGSSTAHYGGFTEIMCAGNVVTLTAPPSKPSVSVTVGLNKILVGTLTSTELYTSISNALETLCPSVTSGSTVTVGAGTQTISNIFYVKETPVHDGELLVSMDTGVYSDAGIRSAMIQAVAQSFMSSATGSNCFNTTWENREHGQTPYEETVEMCNAANFAGVHYYGSVPYGTPIGNGTQWIEPHIDFGIEAGSFDCSAFIEALNSILVVIAPEFAFEETEIGELIAAVCAVATGG
ncbi:hypothetical protein BDZ45DRAFT_675398 [Acephala macrosclerotiorum]|nr:hypothetical protein BDZ45DRAFT_675398 [Acephala macrosclerotiorum]